LDVRTRSVWIRRRLLLRFGNREVTLRFRFNSRLIFNSVLSSDVSLLGGLARHPSFPVHSVQVLVLIRRQTLMAACTTCRLFTTLVSTTTSLRTSCRHLGPYVFLTGTSIFFNTWSR
jgi:hypothetical protein